MKIALAQINPIVGDLQNNALKIAQYVQKAKNLKADVVAFGELAICGYPPEDLLLKPKFVRDNLSQLKSLASSINGINVIVGFVDSLKSKIYNAAALVCAQKIAGVYHKMFLPNYGVFDEKRYFEKGVKPFVAKIAGANIGITICEDIWHKEGPIKLEHAKGAKLVFVINASPYHAGKVKEREEIIKKQARNNKVFIAYVNIVGGQDELVFDGYSMVCNPQGKVIARAEGFMEDLIVVDIPVGNKFQPDKLPVREIKTYDPVEEIYQALRLGLKDYVSKNGFKKAVIGLSGGIDSALVAALAVDALGKDNVDGVFMPSRYSSVESKEDSEELSRNLGIEILNIPISEIFGVYLKVLEPGFKGAAPDITEENLQARIRGNILMALSNKFGWLVLTTGNKSEMSTGYATLYGDMAGGFAVIKDVPKTLVYKLANFRNLKSSVIPKRIIEKEPTAELRPNQKDTDSLPPYPTLDPILKYYIEEDLEFKKIVSAGFDEKTVQKVLNLVDKSEYKRRQSPPGIKITPRAFGKDRRMPITNKFTESGRK